MKITKNLETSFFPNNFWEHIWLCSGVTSECVLKGHSWRDSRDDSLVLEFELGSTIYRASIVHALLWLLLNAYLNDLIKMQCKSPENCQSKMGVNPSMCSWIWFGSIWGFYFPSMFIRVIGLSFSLIAVLAWLASGFLFQ